MTRKIARQLPARSGRRVVGDGVVDWEPDENDPRYTGVWLDDSPIGVVWASDDPGLWVAKAFFGGDGFWTRAGTFDGAVDALVVHARRERP